MELLFDFPILFPSSLSILLLVLSALFVEKHYIGRLAIAANVFFAWELLAPHWVELPELVQFYLYLGLLFAVISILSYTSKKSLSTSFYETARILFGSITILLIILYFVYV